MPVEVHRRLLKRPASAPPTKSAARQQQAKRGKVLADSTLRVYLKEILKKLTTTQRKRLTTNLQQDFSMSSACTGSGMAEMVFATLCNIIGTPCICNFSCEKVQFKRDFVTKVVGPWMSNHGDCCMFCDMTSLPERVAPCKTHGKDCKVPERMACFTCGFSCKDLSKLSTAQKEHILRKAIGSSGKTLAALLNFARVCKPKTMILENVDALEEKPGGVENDNLEFLYQAMHLLSYSVSQRTLISSKFALPQQRKRVFFLCVHHESFGLTAASGQALVDRILDNTSNFEVPCGTMLDSDLILEGDDQLVQAELERRQEQLAPASKGPKDLELLWPREHAAFFQTKGLSWKDMEASEELVANPWYQCLPRRYKEVLDYQLWRMANPPAADSDNAGAEATVTSLDLSQSINRTTRGYDGIFQTITPKAMMWLPTPASGPARCLLGFEAMTLQGFPAGVLREAPAQEFSDSQLADLAGNAFSGTVFGCILISLLAELPSAVHTKYDDKFDNLEAVFALMS